MGGDEMSKMGEEEPCFQRRPQIVLVPFPAQGHVTPMLHLGAALRRHGFRPILVLPASIYRRLPPSSTVQAGGHDGVEANGASEVVIASIPDGIAEGAQGDFFALERAMEEVMPAHFEGWLRSGALHGPAAGQGSGRGRRGCSSTVACVVVDLLASWAMAASARCKVPVAGFWPAMLATYRLVSAAPDLVERRLISASGIPPDEVAIPLSDHALPRCTPALSTADLPWLVGDVAAQRARFAFWQRTLDRSRTLRWLLVNTFAGEGCGGTADGPHNRRRSPCSCVSLSSPLVGRPRVYPVGPLAAGGGNSTSGAGLSFWEEDRSCMEWLDAQMPGSVVYVSFGSWVGPIGDGSVRELALGLEATGRPFLWVLGDSWRAGLPQGFPARMAGRGRLVRWAPQRDVLGHGAVGCYLTHCGWNSTMEAVQSGKRLLCYPVAGDQFINCKYIVDAWGIGVRLDGMRQAAVEDGVERVMGADGEKLQRRVTEMSEEMNGDEGSARAAAELVAFVEELRGYRAAVHERGVLRPAASHDQLPLAWARGIFCSGD